MYISYNIYLLYYYIYLAVLFLFIQKISVKKIALIPIAVVCGGVKSCGNDSEIDGSRNFKQSKVLLKGIYLLNF